MAVNRDQPIESHSRDSIPAKGLGYRLALRLSVTAGFLSIAATAVMLHNHWRLQVADPLTSEELESLKSSLALGMANDSTIQEIRELDQRLRSEYFRRRRKTSVGAYILVISSVLTIAGLRTVLTHHRTAPEPPDPELLQVDEGREAGRSRWAVGAVGVAMLGFTATLIMTASGPTRSVPLAASPPRQMGVPQTGADGIPASTEKQTPESNWPRFRGQEGAGVVFDAEAHAYPDQLDADVNLLWKTPIALPGHGSPIVWADRLFCTGATEEDRNVYCLDARSGNILWVRRCGEDLGSPVGEESVPTVLDQTGYAAPSPVTDGRRVFALFASGDLAAYDFEGRRIWSESLGIPANHYGHASSLEAHDGLVFVQYDQGYDDDALSVLIAFGADTGDAVWDAPRSTSASWSSPIVARVGKRKQLITAADPWVIAYDPQTGRQLWRAKVMVGDVACAPVYDSEANVLLAASPWSHVTAVRADGSGDVTESGVIWTLEEGVPDICSPLTDGRYAYFLTTGGVLTCCDIRTGRIVWRHEFEGMSFHASPIQLGDRIYLTTIDGVTLTIRTGDRFEEIARGRVGEKVHASVVFSRGRVYVRGERHVYCFGGRRDGG
jgi:outer membrane protein assembly factor BamB